MGREREIKGTRKHNNNRHQLMRRVNNGAANSILLRFLRSPLMVEVRTDCNNCSAVGGCSPMHGGQRSALRSVAALHLD